MKSEQTRRALMIVLCSPKIRCISVCEKMWRIRILKIEKTAESLSSRNAPGPKV